MLDYPLHISYVSMSASRSIKEALILAEAVLRDDPTDGNLMVTVAVLRASLGGPKEGLASFRDFLALMSPISCVREEGEREERRGEG